jgi:hypothetical protein
MEPLIFRTQSYIFVLSYRSLKSKSDIAVSKLLIINGFLNQNESIFF